MKNYFHICLLQEKMFNLLPQSVSCFHKDLISAPGSASANWCAANQPLPRQHFPSFLLFYSLFVEVLNWVLRKIMSEYNHLHLLILNGLAVASWVSPVGLTLQSLVSSYFFNILAVASSWVSLMVWVQPLVSSYFLNILSVASSWVSLMVWVQSLVSSYFLNILALAGWVSPVGLSTTTGFFLFLEYFDCS